MFFRPQHVHFTGIGGIGMSGLAEVLLNLRFKISGSDLRLSPTTERLEKLGATVWQGHDGSPRSKPPMWVEERPSRPSSQETAAAKSRARSSPHPASEGLRAGEQERRS